MLPKSAGTRVKRSDQLLATGKAGLLRPMAFVGLALVLAAVFGACAARASARGAAAPPGLEGGGFVVKKAADPSNVCVIIPNDELRARLSPEQFAVLVESETEPAFRNAYWDNHAKGIYVDAIDGTPLFSSQAKYDSGSGWPSFYAPIDDTRVELVEDLSYGMVRVEVRSKSSGGHLGHVFDDGPDPSGLRWCINSASLRFVPLAELEKEGYGELAKLFK